MQQAMLQDKCNKVATDLGFPLSNTTPTILSMVLATTFCLQVIDNENKGISAFFFPSLLPSNTAAANDLINLHDTLHTCRANPTSIWLEKL
eukprot:14347925-Ditylum_brightwellii.AAC.1